MSKPSFFSRSFLLALQKEFDLNGLDLRVSTESAVNFGIQIGFATLSLGAMLALSRFIGVEEYGAYSNAIAWANIFSVFAPLGFGLLLIRDIAILRSKENWSLLRGLLNFSDLVVLLVSILVAFIIAVVGTFVFSAPEQEVMRVCLFIAAIIVPLWSLAILRQSAMRGFEKPIHAMVPDLIIRPALTLVGILIVFLLWPRYLNAASSLWITILASTIALLVATIWTNRIIPKEVQVKPAIQVKVWFDSALPMLILNSAQIVTAQSPVVLLGLFSQARDVGFFNVAARLSGTMIYLPLAFGTVLCPIVARLYSLGERNRLQKLMKTSTRIIFLSNLILFAGFLFWGDKILGFFGAEFVAARSALIILALGCVIDGALGNSALVLSMTGREGIVAKSLSLTAILNIIIASSVIPFYGFVGVAVVNTVVMSLFRLYLAWFVFTKMDLNISVFPGRSTGWN
jgi:O-antigen/teichoic acid export membrane protein